MRSLLAPLVLVFSISIASAQTVHWSPRSGSLVDGANELHVTQSGVLVASGRLGFWVSSDFGHTWLHRLDTLRVQTGVIPIGDALIRLEKDIERSTDYGITWNVIRTLRQGASITLADTLGDMLLYDGSIISWSSDFGHTWRDDSTTTAIRPWRFGPSHLVWAYRASRFFVSTDYGITWELKGRLAPSGWDTSGLYYARSHDSIFVSTDTGSSWRYRAQGPVGSLQVLPNGVCWIVSEASDSEIRHVTRSTDGCRTWTEMPVPRGKYGAGTVLEADGRFYLGSEDGVFVSNDTGRTWTQPYRPITELGETGDMLDICSASDGSIYVFNNFGVWQSKDDGSSWQLLNLYGDGERGPRTSALWPVAITPSDGDVFCASHNSVFRVDSILTAWPQLCPDTLAEYTQILSDHGNSLLLRCYRNPRSRLYQSTDGGSNWTDISPANLDIYSAVVASNGTVFAAGGQGPYVKDPRVVRRSPQSGAWTEVGARLVAAIGTIKDRFYYLTEDSLLYRSYDGGLRFDSLRLSFSVAPYSGMVFDSSGGILIVGPRGLMRSTDEGASWDEINDGLNGITNAPKFCIDAHGYGWFVSSQVYRTDSPLTNSTSSVAIDPPSHSAVTFTHRGRICTLAGGVESIFFIHVYNTVGQCVMSATTSGSFVMPDGPQGIYYVAVRSGGSQYVFKVML